VFIAEHIYNIRLQNIVKQKLSFYFREKLAHLNGKNSKVKEKGSGAFIAPRLRPATQTCARDKIKNSHTLAIFYFGSANTPGVERTFRRFKGVVGIWQ